MDKHIVRDDTIYFEIARQYFIYYHWGTNRNLYKLCMDAHISTTHYGALLIEVARICKRTHQKKLDETATVNHVNALVTGEMFTSIFNVLSANILHHLTIAAQSVASLPIHTQENFNECALKVEFQLGIDPDYHATIQGYVRIISDSFSMRLDSYLDEEIVACLYDRYDGLTGEPL